MCGCDTDKSFESVDTVRTKFYGQAINLLDKHSKDFWNGLLVE